MPGLLDYNTFSEELKEVNSIKALDKKKFHARGLFSEQIFGPVKNYTCQCGVYYGISRSGGVCEDCNVPIVNSDVRRKTFAKITLPIPVVNPVFFDLINHIGGNFLKEPVQELMRNESSVLFIDDGDYLVAKGPEFIPEGVTETWDGIEAIQKIVYDLAEGQASTGHVGWKLLFDKIEHLFIHQVIVLPPELRPTKVIEDRIEYDEINKYYQQILTKKHIMEETIVDVKNNKALFYNYYKQLQKDVFELYDVIIKKLSKKEGLIRGNILGKRIDFSGRAIISPDPTLELNECSLPYLMFLELWKLQIAKKLILIGKYRLLNEAIDFVDECIDLKKPILFKICEDLAKDQVCILNRQPSLHRLSMMAFDVKLSLDTVIKIHPLVCPGFNADFDGDQMAVYIPLTEDAKAEVIDKIHVIKNLSNPADNSLSTTPSQDIVLGIYTLTSNQFPDLQGEVEYKETKMTESFKMFNECFPEDYPVITGVVGKKELMKILNIVKNNYEPVETSHVLDNIKRLGFKYSTLYGATMSLDEFELPGSQEIKDALYAPEEIVDQLIAVTGPATEQVLKDNFKYSYMIESGARGSWDQARQIILTRGFISNFNGQIIPEPIKSSLIDGLEEKEFFNSTYGCRKGLLDVALNTGASGYLSRKLIFACANLQISRDVADCGTTDMLDVHVSSMKKARGLIGRWYNETGCGQEGLLLITEENCASFIDKTIWLRSPIFCTDDRLCMTCYGKLHETLDSRFVGVIAAQSLGECNTQLVLRVFHTSGVAQHKEGQDREDMKQMDIVSDLSMASKLLHSSDDGNYKDKTSQLFDVYNSNRSIHHIHFECIVSQLMWSGYKKWRLIENRHEIAPSYYSVQKVPSMESWLLGLAFSNPKKHILNGILETGQYNGIMDKILCGEKI